MTLKLPDEMLNIPARTKKILKVEMNMKKGGDHKLDMKYKLGYGLAC
jgi:hypothetical protein